MITYRDFWISDDGDRFVDLYEAVKPKSRRSRAWQRDIYNRCTRKPLIPMFVVNSDGTIPDLGINDHRTEFALNIKNKKTFHQFHKMIRIFNTIDYWAGKDR
jgi:hypothetical protein